MPVELQISPGTTRAAVVIGVDQTGLPRLNGAAGGAADMQQWLKDEGYHVTAHTDADDKPVTRADIFATIDAYTNFPTIEKLVVYFAGHGFYSSGNEIWLLTGAPNDPAEAINLKSNEEFARMTRLKHVIFIADTCRSLPQDYQMQQVKGASVFPSTPLGGTCEVDTFFATLVGAPALEVAVDAAMEDYEGLFTRELMDIHKAAEAGDLVDAEVDGKLTKVFPNRRLKKRLPLVFTQTVRRRGIRTRQLPSLRIESDEPVHLASATLAPPPAAPGITVVNPQPFAVGARAETIERAARKLLELDAVPAKPKRKSPNNDLTLMRLADEARSQLTAKQSAHFETGSGAIVTGTEVEEAIAIGPFGIDRETADAGEAKLRFKNNPNDYSPLETPFSAIIRFADGSGTIVAALPRFVAALDVGNGGVVSVSYTPAEGTWEWQEYEHFREQVEHRRAMAATAARNGVLALNREDALAFGDRIRIGKSKDPTLGLYAALAYAGVGLRDKTKSVLEFMQSDMRANLFDPWLLAGGDPAELSDAMPRVPVCPMLSQSWDYLAPFHVELPPVLEKAGRFPALWTTFLPEAMDKIVAAAKSGELS